MYNLCINSNDKIIIVDDYYFEGSTLELLKDKDGMEYEYWSEEAAQEALNDMIRPEHIDSEFINKPNHSRYFKEGKYEES